MDNSFINQSAKLTILSILTLALAVIIPTNPIQAQSPKHILDDFIADPELKSASISVCFLDAETKETVLASKADKALAPASSLKVLTTQSALHMFGPEATFKTEIIKQGTVDENGVLKGDIIIKGYGDPAFDSPRFEEHYKDVWNDFVIAIAAEGITKIEGNIIGDNSYFGAYPIAGSTQVADIGNYYGGSAHALNLWENTFELYFASGAAGTEARVLKTVPELPGVTFKNNVLADKSSKDNAFIYGLPYQTQLWINGTIPENQKEFIIKGAMPDPAYIAASVLEAYIEINGIDVTGYAYGVNQRTPLDSEVVIAEKKSPTMAQIVEVTNKKSINMYANVLYFQIGLLMKGDATFKAGAQAIKEHWNNIGVNLDTYIPADGSGLSRQNAITSRQLALVTSYIDEQSGEDFKNSLKPMSNVSNCFVKSGYIFGVRSYTGFLKLKGEDGKVLCFSVIVNNHSCSATQARKKIENLLTRIQNY